MTGFVETEEQKALRQAVATMATNYGQEYYLGKARAGEHTTELWAEAGKLGFIGVNLPEEYGGGGAGMYELSLVMEEMSAAGSALLMMVVSPAINGTIISKFGTDDQKRRWLPGIADGSITMAFAITEPDAGSNSHRITTTARRDGGDWRLNGQKVYISGVDQAQAQPVVAGGERGAGADGRQRAGRVAAPRAEEHEAPRHRRRRRGGPEGDPPDPGVPLASDRPAARRRADGRGDQRQEGPVPGAVGHEERDRQGPCRAAYVAAAEDGRGRDQTTDRRAARPWRR